MMKCKCSTILLLLVLIKESFSFTISKSRMNHLTLLKSTTIFSDKSLSVPPKSFINCVKQAVEAAKKSLSNNDKLMEVEFPPLPLEYLEDSSSSARDIADANTRWALEFAKSFGETGLKVSVIYPDQAELDDAIKYVDMGGTTTPFPNVTMATIRTDSVKNAKSIDQIISSIFGATIGGTVQGIPGTDMYVAVVSSSQELPDLEKLHLLEPNIPIVLFNLRLDILDLHHRFLSNVRPVYLMRSRAFSTSLRRPPFVINYSGLLYRVYPEPYQSILNTGQGSNRVADIQKERPTNKGFRDSLTSALKVPGVPPEELQTTGNLVWWEKEYDQDLSTAWRF